MTNAADLDLGSVIALVEDGKFEDALRYLDKFDKVEVCSQDQHGRLTALQWYCSYCLDDSIEISDFERRLSKEDCSEFLNGFGTQLGEIEAFAQAEPAFKRLVDIEPNRSKAWHKLGLTLLREGRIEGALEPLQKAIELDPKFPSSHFLMGECFREIGQPENAASSYANCVELTPDDLDAVILCGIANSEAGNSSKAIELFKRAIEIEPASASAYFNLAVVAFCKEDVALLKDAQSGCARHAELDPRSTLIDSYVEELAGDLGAAWKSLDIAFQSAASQEEWETLDATVNRALSFCGVNGVPSWFDAWIDRVFLYEVFNENVFRHIREAEGTKIKDPSCFSLMLDGELDHNRVQSGENASLSVGYILRVNVIATDKKRAGELAFQFDRRCGRSPHSIVSVDPVVESIKQDDMFEGVYWCSPKLHTYLIN